MPVLPTELCGKVSTGSTSAPFGLRSDVWTYGVIKGQTTKDKLAHPDPMAEKRAEDLILSFSRPGDLVFDPMCGSGTTLKMALLNHRKYLGCEIHKPYWAEAVKRLKKYEEEYKKQLDEGFSPKIIVPRLAQPPKPIKVPTIITPSKATIRIENADVLAVLKGLESNSFDGMLGAFPYALVNRVSKKRRKSTRGFMGKEWDGSLPSVEVCSEASACRQAWGRAACFRPPPHASPPDDQHRRCWVDHPGHDDVAVRAGKARLPRHLERN